MLVHQVHLQAVPFLQRPTGVCFALQPCRQRLHRKAGCTETAGLHPKRCPVIPKLPEVGDLQLLCTAAGKVSRWIKGALAAE